MIKLRVKFIGVLEERLIEVENHPNLMEDIFRNLMDINSPFIYLGGGIYQTSTIESVEPIEEVNI